MQGQAMEHPAYAPFLKWAKKNLADHTVLDRYWLCWLEGFRLGLDKMENDCMTVLKQNFSHVLTEEDQ